MKNIWVNGGGKGWLALGLLFCAIVIGMISFGLIKGPSMEGGGHSGEYQGFVLLDAPDYVVESIPIAREKLAGKFDVPTEVTIAHEPHLQLCEQVLDGENVVFPCVPGFVLVTTMTERYQDCTMESCEGGRAIFDLIADPPYCTIFVQANIKDALPLDEIGELEQQTLPPDAEHKVFTHEFVHCARGEGHTETRLAPGVVMEESGHLMNPSIFKIGWGLKGL